MLNFDDIYHKKNRVYKMVFIGIISLISMGFLIEYGTSSNEDYLP